jgi:hypothetical protein
MDYILTSSMRDVITPVVVAYDVACQYTINFWKRAQSLPDDLYPKIKPEQLDFFVGIMHIYGHVSRCQGPWSGRYRPGNANTPGDNVEHAWVPLNQLSRSLSRMTPGQRIDSLNSAMDALNFQKLVRSGT